MRASAATLLVALFVIASAGCGGSTTGTTTAVTTTAAITTAPSTAVTTTAATTTTPSSTTTVPAVLTYEDPDLRFSFDYPSDFASATPGVSLRTPGGGYVFLMSAPAWVIADQASCEGLAAMALEGARQTDPEETLESATYYLNPNGTGICKWVTIGGDGAVYATYAFNGPGGSLGTTIELAVAGGTGEDSRTLFDGVADTIRLN
jgi:hypothetical protein